MREKTDLPVLAVNTDGMELYDGENGRLIWNFLKFLPGKNCRWRRAGVGILGMTPQDVSDLKAADKFREKFKSQGHQAVCYGMGDGLDEVKKPPLWKKNIVVSPAALECARYLEKTFGTPYEVGYPLVEELVPDMEYAGKKILIVQQQVMAGSIRAELRKRGGDGKITVASWFSMEKDLLEEGDVSLKDEEDYMDLVEKGRYDVIFCRSLYEADGKDVFRCVCGCGAFCGIRKVQVDLRAGHKVTYIL